MWYRGWLNVASRGMLCLVLLPAAILAQPLTVTHFAGPIGGPGLVDGTGISASFRSPTGVAVDTAGNVFVADWLNSVIRQITPRGVVTTLAGSSAIGSTDAIGTAASFHNPYGVAVDGSGNVYVADTYNNKIRKIAPGGVVTTLAGSGASGSVDGTGAAASFNGPMGVAVDVAGNVIVGDTSSNKIRKVSPGGIVTTIAGSGTPGSLDGTGTAAQFKSPVGVAVDPSGSIFVADRLSYKIRRIAPDGNVTTYAGSGLQGPSDGTGTAARFYLPSSVALDGAGNLFVADSTQNKIRKIAPGGIVTTFAGSNFVSSADGTGPAAGFNYPAGVATDAAGNVYVADEGNSKIRKITPAAVVTTFAGSGSTGTADGAAPVASFSNPAGIAADGAGNVYVTDAYASKLRKISSGVVTTLAGSGFGGGTDGTGTAASFYRPWGIAVDRSGNIYVAEVYGNRIRKVTPAGVVTTLAGAGTIGSADGTGAGASFHYPRAVAVDGSGNVYVADTENNKIRKVTPGGTVTTLAGSGAHGGADGTGQAATFNTLSGIAVDGSGVVYVSDLGRIRKVTPDGVVTTFAGTGSNRSEDGQGIYASFSDPAGLAVDGSGNVWVSESGANKIRKITPGGLVTTVAGSGGYGSTDGTGAAATFASPEGIAVDSSGNVYVADSLNNAIRLGRNMGSATCTPDETNLCLLGGRFRLSADYITYDGTPGSGKAVYLTPDTGYFWFFNAANVEVVAKMVSFCGSGSDNVGVYAGGLTDLGVTLHVTDTRDGTSMDHQNTLGTGFRMVQDGRFHCPAGVTGEPGPIETRAVDEATLETTTIREGPPGLEGVCTADGTTLCILGGRFQVKASYLDYEGKTGQGQAVPVTSDTGYFWFFGSSNVETVVKMVSFCGSGSNNIAVYAGGMTDVQVALTVTDVQTGFAKTYTNPLGTQFKLISDGPFSCP